MPKSVVYNEDCLSAMKKMPDKCFELCIADPPYGSGGSDFKRKDNTRFGGWFDKYKQESQQVYRTGCGWATKYTTKIKEWDVAPPQEYFDELFRVADKIILWGGNYFSLPPTRCFIVWRKLSISENFSMAMCEYAWTNFNDNAKYFEYAPQARAGEEERWHPTSKPVELYKFCLKHFAKPGDRILDTHLGSGSSRIAAYDMGFDFVGYEIGEEYFKLGNERFEAITSQTSMFN